MFYLLLIAGTSLLVADGSNPSLGWATFFAFIALIHLVALAKS